MGFNYLNSTLKEKAKAKELIKTWSRDSLQFKLNALMIDVHIFTNLQKGLQKSNLVLPDVLTLRDIAVRKFNILVSGPMPGGKEEEAINRNKQNNVTIHSHLAAEENVEQRVTLNFA